MIFPIKEKFCQLRDKIVLYKDVKNLNVKCFSCNRVDHSIIGCPDIFLQPNVELIIKKHCYNPKTRFRNTKFKRKRIKKSSNALFNVFKNRESVLDLREQLFNESILSESDLDLDGSKQTYEEGHSNHQLDVDI